LQKKLKADLAATGWIRPRRIPGRFLKEIPSTKLFTLAKIL